MVAREQAVMSVACSAFCTIASQAARACPACIRDLSGHTSLFALLTWRFAIPVPLTPHGAGLQITKEVRSGQYRLISFYLARQLVSVPFESAIALLFTVIVYFMIGFQTAAAKYFIFAATLLLVNLISEMVGFIMGVILKVCYCPFLLRV